MTDRSAELLAAYRLGVLHGGKIEQLLFGSGPGGTSGSAPERQSPAGDQDRGLPLDGCAPTRDHAPGGRGPRTTEPDAWAVLLADGRIYDVYDLEEEAKAIDSALTGKGVTPLYRHPQPALTDAEREAVEWAINVTSRKYDDPDGGPLKREALRGLLERL